MFVLFVDVSRRILMTKVVFHPWYREKLPKYLQIKKSVSSSSLFEKEFCIDDMALKNTMARTTFPKIYDDKTKKEIPVTENTIINALKQKSKVGSNNVYTVSYELFLDESKSSIIDREIRTARFRLDI